MPVAHGSPWVGAASLEVPAFWWWLGQFQHLPSCFLSCRAQNHLGKPQKVRIAPGAAAAAQPRLRGGEFLSIDRQTDFAPGACRLLGDQGVLGGLETPRWRSSSVPWHHGGSDGAGSAQQTPRPRLPPVCAPAGAGCGQGCRGQRRGGGWAAAAWPQGPMFASAGEWPGLGRQGWGR